MIATALKHNHDLVRSISVTIVFDYRSPTIMQDIISTLLGRELIGVYDAILELESINLISLILDQIGAHKVGIIVPLRVALSQNFIPTMYKILPQAVVEMTMEVLSK